MPLGTLLEKMSAIGVLPLPADPVLREDLMHALGLFRLSLPTICLGVIINSFAHAGTVLGIFAHTGSVVDTYAHTGSVLDSFARAGSVLDAFAHTATVVKVCP